MGVGSRRKDNTLYSSAVSSPVGETPIAELPDPMAGTGAAGALQRVTSQRRAHASTLSCLFTITHKTRPDAARSFVEPGLGKI